MKKKVLLFLFFALLTCGLQAQTETPLSATESRKLTASLTQAAASMQTLQCRFVQRKTSSMLAEPALAEGMMHYVAPDKMRWEYTAPYAFALVVDGDRIVKEADGKAETTDVKKNRMYQGMADLIMGGASGKRLFDTAAFDVAFYDENGFWRAEMTPKKRDMKRVLSRLVFRFDKTTGIISRVAFVDSGGDETSITFSDLQLNTATEFGKRH